MTNKTVKKSRNSLALQKSSESGLEYLKLTQLSDGSFVSYSSSSVYPFSLALEYKSNFSCSTILNSLSVIKGDISNTIKSGLSEYLLSEMSENKTLNYWSSKSHERHTLPYPDDLDDTFCALSGIFQFKNELITPELVASFVRILTHAELKPGGPYKTWFVPAEDSEAWHDTDLVVNCNIAFFLRMYGVDLPPLNKYIEEAIINNSYSSQYYSSKAVILYFLSRSYNGPLRSKLNDVIERELLRKKNNVLDTAALLSSVNIEHLGFFRVLPLLKKLLNTQQLDGSWLGEAFCIDPSINGKKHYNGGPAITTAFVLEAFGKVAVEENKTNTLEPMKISDEVLIMKQVLLSTNAALKSLPNSTYKKCTGMVEKICFGDTTNEAILLPHRTLQAFEIIGDHAKGLATILGTGSLLGWLAYTIHDDFLDGEGSPPLLPVANLASRASIDSFLKPGKYKDTYRNYVQGVFDTMDKANAWELANCRFRIKNDKIFISRLPNYMKLEKLAERSLGHTLAPVLALAYSKYTFNSIEVKRIQKVLFNYLVGRQLSDDLHDWEDDFLQGRITYVVAQILEKMPKKRGEQKVEELLPEMRKVYWNDVFKDVCTIMTERVSTARKELSKIKGMAEVNIFHVVLDQIQIISESSVRNYDQTRQFLTFYHE